jgi:hypothetical protein
MSSFTDRERLDAVEKGLLFICEKSHIVHKVGCIVMFSERLRQLSTMDNVSHLWRSITWREAIDAAMLAAGLKPTPAGENL